MPDRPHQRPAWEYSGSPRSLLPLPHPNPLESEFCFFSLDGPRVADAVWGAHSQGVTKPARAAAPWTPQLRAQPRLILHHYDLLVLPSETLPRKELDSGTPGSIPQPSLFFLLRKMLHDTQSILLKRCAATRKVWGR